MEIHNDLCDLALLEIVSRGDSIITEILRLKEYIPPVYKLNNKQDVQKYGKIILDFSYFNNPTEYDKIIYTNPTLQDIDEELKEYNLVVIKQFYFLFKNVYKYIHDLNGYIDELEEGTYIQHSLETMFQTFERKQLLCESLYLYGIILLFIDIYIDGTVRERLLVAYHRYNAQEYSSENPIDDICKLLRSTVPNSIKYNPLYIETYFKRVPVNKNLVNLAIERLRSDDIYNQLPSYPNQKHRNTALAKQAAMLFVSLFFKPIVLHEEFSTMRGIVDNFFQDNWVINIYMGETINMIDSWEPFKAAKIALSNTIDTTNISQVSKNHEKFLFIEHLINDLNRHHNIEESILNDINSVMNLCRDLNFILRSFFLHTSTDHLLSENTKKSMNIYKQFTKQTLYNDDRLFDLLVLSSEFEMKVKDKIQSLLEEKEARFLNKKDECINLINELSEVFERLSLATRIKQNDNLQVWFVNIGRLVKTICMEDIHASNRQITEIIKALDEVKEYHQVERNYPVCETIKDIICCLHGMINTICIKESALIDLKIIGDFSYAWCHINRFTHIMQRTIKKDPAFVNKLRPIFLKLETCINGPTKRINQYSRGNCIAINEYYSNELKAYIRHVLHIIPKTIFKYMTDIATLQTDIIKEIPTRLEKYKLNEYAQPDERIEVAKLTHSISVLMYGVLDMRNTLFGVVQINLKQLLDDGIKKELVQHIAVALHNGLIFNTKVKTSELLSKLDELSSTMTGYRQSFVYIQDYIDVFGLKIWQEELTRIIGFNVEMECNSFMRAKILDWQSVYQSKVVPVPSFKPCDDQSMTFIGRLAREIIRITDPKVAVYREQTTAWYDYKTNEEIINMRFYSNIINSINICGLTGLDKLIGFMIVAEITKLLDYLQKNVINDREWLQILESVANELVSDENTSNDPIKSYHKQSLKLRKILPTILKSIMKIGQLQIIRKQIFFELEISCKLNARNVFDCLSTMNRAVFNEIQSNFKDPENKPYPPNDNQLLSELSKMMDWAGIGNPYSKIYVTTEITQYISLISFVLTITQFPKLQYVENLALLMCKKLGEPIDGAPLYIGLQTFLKQFHSDITTQYLDYLAHYLKSIISHCSKSIEKLEIPYEYQVAQFFVERFMIVGELNNQIFDKMVPFYLTDTLQYVYDLSIKQ